ncbi:MAG: hypothetical protein HQ508_01265 [Candidatus Marinimicrobia bacterium]|nr:hypothetical protein [Candidatus Neomarinimicrobiota bacterium]
MVKVKPPCLKSVDTTGLVSPKEITRGRDKVKIIEETLIVLDLKLSVATHIMKRWDYLPGRGEDRAAATRSDVCQY